MAIIVALTFVCVSAAAQDDGTDWFRADAAEARVWLTAADRHGVPITDLAASSLLVLDEGAARPVTSLARVDASPVRVLFVVDVSGSDARWLSSMQAALKAFASRLAPPGNRLRITLFSDRAASLTLGAGDAPAVWKTAAKLSHAVGTALYDNLFPALSACRDYDAIVLISDGEDNWSLHHSLRDTSTAAKGMHGRLFAIGLRAGPGTAGGDALRTLAASGNGEFLFVRSRRELGRALDGVAGALRSYYALSFPIAAAQRDGRFHRVVVRSSDRRVARIQGREGYFAPSATAAAASVFAPR